MTSQNERAARALKECDRVFDLPVDDRLRYIREHFAAEPELLRELEGLVAAAETADRGLLGRSAEDLLQPVLDDLRTDVSASDAGFVELVAPALAPRYQLHEGIGRGGAARVFLAHDTKLDRVVALKILRPELADVLPRNRFALEIEIATRLEHDRIVPIYDWGDSSGLMFYAMRYVSGGSLRDHLSLGGGEARRLEIRDAMSIARQVAQALDHAHSHGVVHRDIKPENILLDSGGAYVADFGVARLLDAADKDRLTRTGIAIGTAHYMSPEQIESSRTVDARSDVYSLACVLFEMLAGEPPYTGPTRSDILSKHLAATIPDLSVVRRTVTPTMQGVLAKALSKTSADRYKSATEFVDAFDRAYVSGAAARWPFRMSWQRVAAVAGLAAAAVLVQTFSRPNDLPNPDPNLVAVAPFEVMDPALAVWREGMPDLLSRALDGAGPLRTVPTTTVLKGWSGKSDRESARNLARRTGAGLALFGLMAPSGPDSVWMAVRVLDAAGDRVVVDVEMTDDLSRIGRWQRDLTLAVLRQLAAIRPVGSAPVYSLGSTSLPALKDFLQGEQQFRRTAFDSAAFYYERAVSADSTFALPLHRLYGLSFWQQSGADLRARGYALRAGALNHGLPPRDSLLVAAESLSAAYPYSSYASHPAFWSHSRRLLATLGEAARRYPEDPEVWYSLALAQYTYGHALGFSSPRILEAVDRSIRHDSTFAPAYLSGVLLANRLGQYEASRGYAQAYLRHGPAGRQADAIKLMFRLEKADRADREKLMREASNEVLFATFNNVAWWTDPDELAVQIAHELSRRTTDMSPTDSIIATFDLGFALAWRGYVDSAHKVIGNQPSRLFGAVAILGGVPTDTVATVFGKLLGVPAWPPTQLPMAISWWAGRRDTVSLLLTAQRAEEVLKNPASGFAGAYAGRLSQSARAQLLLIRGDTTAGIEQLKALPDTACPACFSERIVLARLLIARGSLQDAASLLGRDLADPSAQNNPLAVLWELERGRLAERMGDQPKARRHYGFVEAAWSRADTNLQWVVDSARSGRRRMTGR